MKYVFIEKRRAEFSVKTMCRVLRVARSGWYAWRLRRHQITPRQQFRLVCDDAVRKAFNDAKQRYGAPRLADELPVYNVKTIAASLRRQGLRAKVSCRFSPVSYREHGLPVSENLLNQNFCASGRNRKWAGDITYLRTDEGWLYLAVVIDQCRRKRPENIIVHTDRGDQYCSADYQSLLKRHNLRGSMSARGCCYDNACGKASSTR